MKLPGQNPLYEVGLIKMAGQVPRVEAYGKYDAQINIATMGMELDNHLGLHWTPTTLGI